MDYTISQTLHDCLVGFSMILSVCSIWFLTTLALKTYYDREKLINELKDKYGSNN